LPHSRRDAAGAARPLVLALLPALVLAACGSEAPARPAGDRAGVAPPADRALLAAARAGDVSGVRRALERGASVRARDPGGATALVLAAYGNHLGAARVLTGAGADVNAKDATTQSAYLIATSEVGDDPRLLELTLDRRARVNDHDSYDGTGLIRAAERGHARIVRRLLRAGIERDHVNRLGWTALLEAVILGDGGPRHRRTVLALVRGGVDVDLPDGEGVRPLAHAEARGFDGIARILRAAGARR
jgi:ankyrin repeat protein